MIDFQGLLTMLKDAENAPDLHMNSWVNACGTAGCLIGTFCINHKDDALQIVRQPYIYPRLGIKTEAYAIAERFGITTDEAKWLFVCNPLYWTGVTVNANKLTREEAINRLRKFIYYKLHKQEMVVTKGRNNYVVDQKRNLGHVNFVRKTLETCSH